MAAVTFDQALDFTRGSTGTYFDVSGVLRTAAADEPRFDHDPLTGEALGLLIEEQRTNEYRQSQEFSAAEWASDSTGITVTPNDGPELISGKNADLVTFSGGGRLSQLYAGEFERTNSFAVRHVSGEETIRVSTRSQLAVFNVVTGQVVSGSGSIRYLGKGFYLCTLTGTNAASRAALVGQGDGSYHVAYAQLEQAPTPSSYIKTEGTQVTRAADNCSRTLGAEFNASEGTIYSEVVPKYLPPVGFLLVLGDSNPNRVVQFVRRGTGEIAAQFFDNASILYSVDAAYQEGEKIRFAASYGANGWACSVNGVSGSGPETTDKVPSLLRIGSTATGAVTAIATHSTVKVIPRALTEAELITLTTPEA